MTATQLQLVMTTWESFDFSNLFSRVAELLYKPLKFLMVVTNANFKILCSPNKSHLLYFIHKLVICDLQIKILK